MRGNCDVVRVVAIYQGSWLSASPPVSPGVRYPSYSSLLHGARSWGYGTSLTSGAMNIHLVLRHADRDISWRALVHNCPVMHGVNGA